MRQPVSQSLTLGIQHYGSHLEESGNGIHARKKKDKVRRLEPASKEGRSVSRPQAKRELPNTLPSYRIAEEEVDAASREVQDEPEVQYSKQLMTTRKQSMVAVGCKRRLGIPQATGNRCYHVSPPEGGGHAPSI